MYIGIYSFIKRAKRAFIIGFFLVLNADYLITKYGLLCFNFKPS